MKCNNETSGNEKQSQQAKDEIVDSIIEGLVGEVHLGERYYVFTVNYAYIGVVKSFDDTFLVLDDVCIISSAGTATDAVSKIVRGEVSPEYYEWPRKPIIVMRQAITAFIPSERPKG